jgi:hypothetical protein
VQDAVELAHEDTEDTYLGLVDDRLGPASLGMPVAPQTEPFDGEETPAGVHEIPGALLHPPADHSVEGDPIHP